MSPDGKWVAFREGFQVFVTPMVSGKGPLKVGPKMEAQPVSKLSSPAAWNIHWSGDATRVYWSLGSKLMEQSLAKAFPFLREDGERPEEKAVPEAISLDLSFSVSTDIPSGSLVLRGGRVVTMEGDEVIENGVVVIQANRVVAVGAVGEVVIPRGATVIDTRAMTILPGMIDVHAHAGQATEGFVPEQNWENYAALAFGVTTIHDPSNHTESVFAAKEMETLSSHFSLRTVCLLWNILFLH